MICRTCISVLAAAVILWMALTALPAAPAPDKPAEKAAPEPVTISVALEHPDKPAYVGEPLALRITLKNSTGKPLMIMDWSHFESVLFVSVVVNGYPGSPDVFFGLGLDWSHGALMKGDYRELPAGETVISRTVTPMLPGKAFVGVTFDNPDDTWTAGTDGKKRVWDNGWKGVAKTGLNLAVLAELSPEMKKRYDEVSRKLVDPIVLSDQKGQLLVAVAEEKHYFAAKFLREFAEKEPAGPMRDTAIWQLLKLAKVGTAYESIPLLFKWMTEEGTNQETRVAIMDWTAESLAKPGGPFIIIAGQASYPWPESLQKQAREALQKMAEDSNPYLASRAQEAVRNLASPAKPKT